MLVSAPFQVIPSKCACVMSPLLREAEVVPAPGLPVPFGMDAESKRQRARTKKEKRVEQRDAERRYEEWRADLLSRNPTQPVPPCQPPSCAYPPPIDTAALFSCSGQCAGAQQTAGSAAAATPASSGLVSDADGTVTAAHHRPTSQSGSSGVTCPVNLFSDWMFLRDALFRRAPLTCQPAEADGESEAEPVAGSDSGAEVQASGHRLSSMTSVCPPRPEAVVDVNLLHASVCPGEASCGNTVEGSAQGRETDPMRRVRMAIEENRALQKDSVPFMAPQPQPQPQPQHPADPHQSEPQSAAQPPHAETQPEPEPQSQPEPQFQPEDQQSPPPAHGHGRAPAPASASESAPSPSPSPSLRAGTSGAGGSASFVVPADPAAMFAQMRQSMRLQQRGA